MLELLEEILGAWTNNRIVPKQKRGIVIEEDVPGDNYPHVFLGKRYEEIM